MKNVFRKAVAAVVAFTLLGAGTAFTNTVSSKQSSVTATAASISPSQCTPHGQFVKHDKAIYRRDEWRDKDYDYECNKVTQEEYYVVNVYDVSYCKACGYIVKSQKNVSESSVRRTGKTRKLKIIWR